MTRPVIARLVALGIGAPAALAATTELIDAFKVFESIPYEERNSLVLKYFNSITEPKYAEEEVQNLYNSTVNNAFAPSLTKRQLNLVCKYCYCLFCKNPVSDSLENRNDAKLYLRGFL